ncbi:MAG: GNAT family N-acetyltransferase [Actinobacteria bacterium]|nr:GNAT family N-acetyltransferase [Actinomycetota bacterium]
MKWPYRLDDGDLALRPLTRRDKKKWIALRETNDSWLAPWEATLPQNAKEPQINSYAALLRHLNGRARSTAMLPFALEFQGKLVGQVTLGGIVFGAMRSAHIGYWVDESFTGQGLATRAVQILTDHCFSVLQLHRIEISMRPENLASQRVAMKAGFYFEGSRTSYIHIDGGWRDHLTFVRFNPADER